MAAYESGERRFPRIGDTDYEWFPLNDGNGVSAPETHIVRLEPLILEDQKHLLIPPTAEAVIPIDVQTPTSLSVKEVARAARRFRGSGKNKRNPTRHRKAAPKFGH